MSWKQVTKAKPCPVCGKPNWCARGTDGATMCMRIQSDKPSRNGGYLHRNDTNGTANVETPTAVVFPRAVRWSVPLVSFARALSTERLTKLAATLGVSAASLGRLGVGYDDESGAYTFPMQSRPEVVCGVRLRFLDGAKKAVRGSRNGVFAPSGLAGVGPLVICEGPTDVAAMLDLGYDTVGRASCLHGHTELPAWSAGRDAVVIADRDPTGSTAESASSRGTQRLVDSLAAVAVSVRVILPPEGIKDARQWKNQGATRHDVDRAIDECPNSLLTKGGDPMS